MNDAQEKYFERGERVSDFLQARTRDFGSGSIVTETIPVIADLLTRIRQTDAARVSGAGKASTRVKNVELERLREMLERIAETAKSMAVKTSGLEKKFRAPRSISATAMLSLARAFAGDAVPLKAEFERNEIAANFWDELNAAIAAVEASLTGKNTAKGAQKGAGADIDDLIGELNAAVKSIKAAVRNRYAEDAATLAAWTSAVHVKRVPQGNITATPPQS